MKFEIIGTERLYLRKLDKKVYRYVFENYTKKEINIFFGHQSEKEYVRDKKMYEEGVTTFNKGMLMFHLLDKESSLVIGWCGYHTWYKDHMALAP